MSYLPVELPEYSLALQRYSHDGNIDIQALKKTLNDHPNSCVTLDSTRISRVRTLFQQLNDELIHPEKPLDETYGTVKVDLSTLREYDSALLTGCVKVSDKIEKFLGQKLPIAKCPSVQNSLIERTRKQFFEQFGFYPDIKIDKDRVLLTLPYKKLPGDIRILPTELFGLIAQYLSPKDLGSLMLVARKFRSDEMIIQLFARNAENASRFLEHGAEPESTHILKTIQNTLTTLSLTPRVRAEKLCEILTYFPKIDTVDLKNPSVDYLQVLAQFPKLTNVKLQVADDTVASDSINHLLQALPQLKNLTLDWLRRINLTLTTLPATLETVSISASYLSIAACEDSNKKDQVQFGGSLKEIRLHALQRFNFDTFLKALPPTVKILHLAGGGFQDQHITHLERLTELEDLKISRNPKVTGKYFSQLPTRIRRFDCSDCAIDQAAITILHQRLPLLRDLDLSGNSALTIDTIFKTFTPKNDLQRIRFRTGTFLGDFLINRLYNTENLLELSPLMRSLRLEAANFITRIDFLYQDLYQAQTLLQKMRAKVANLFSLCSNNS